MTTTSSPYNIYPGLTPARLVRTSNLAGTYSNGELNNGVGATLTIAASSLTIDSVVCVANDRILLIAQTNDNEDGLYDVTSIGSTVVLTRADDFQSIEQLQLGQYVSVHSGTLNAGAIFVLTEKPAVMGVSDLTFTASPLNSGLGTAAAKAASDDAKSSVASVSGATTLDELSVFADTAGTVKNATTTTTLGFPLIVSGAVSSGKSGTAGIVSSFPSAATTGSLRLVGVANSANVNVSISNASHAQATVYSIQDVGAATGQLLNKTAAFVSGNLIKASGTAGICVDAGFAVKANTTAAYGGGGTSNAFTATGLTTSSIVTAVILASTNAVSIAKAVPTANTLTVTFSADPGAATTVSWIAITPAV